MIVEFQYGALCDPFEKQANRGLLLGIRLDGYKRCGMA